MIAQQIISGDIERVSGAIWRDMLDFEFTPVQVIDFPTEDTMVYVGSIELSGAWNGTVTVLCSRALAELARDKMYRGHAGALGQHETEDVMRELANITGGNLKNSVPEPSTLSLPTVRLMPWGEWKARYQAGSLSFAYRCAGEPCAITVQGCTAEVPDLLEF